MEFLKKNWGLLLCTVVFAALMVYQMMQIMKYQKEYAANESKVEEADKWFKTMNSSGWKVTPNENNVLENAEIAMANKEIAVGHSEEIQRQLVKRFSFSPTLPGNYVQAQEELDRRLSIITDYLLVQNKIQWNCGTPIGGRFYSLAQQAEPIPQSDFPNIFRQLMIYEKLLHHLVGAGVKAIYTLEFPRWLVTEEESDYTLTPIIISVEADAPTIQKLVNNLSYDPSMLIFIRNMDFSVPASVNPAEEYFDIVLQRRSELDQVLAAKLSAAQGNNDRTGGMGMGGMGMGMGTGMNPDMGMGRNRGMGGMMDSMTTGTTQNIDSAFLVPEDPKRQDYLVFRTPRLIHLNLTLDLLEYKAPES
ncbi:MAG: hypothetical protein IKR13_02940 [Victivallales bacterium]|nr:hypothetical protein [Victivallales bacterium]